MRDEISELLKQREERYGKYSDVAEMTQSLMSIIESGASYERVPDTHKIVFFMIANKIARAVNGDPMYDDNYRDIAGYAMLAVEASKNE